jgi:DNA polymerase-4
MILHVDMDAFYASVEERDQPELVGKPVIVGGTPEGRGVVMAANYVVRQFGVRSAMPAATAKRLCPHALFLPPRMAYYAEVSDQIRGIFGRYTPLVEPLSLDEAFLDVTGSEPLLGSSVEIGRRVKQEIRDVLRLTASVGVASNKFLAKIASDLEKPDGFVVVDPGRIEEFLDPLPVGRLWGVGRVTGHTFERLGIQTIGQVRRLPLAILQQHFGQHGDHLWRLAHGQDDRRVVPDREAKSISHETTFAHDIEEPEVLRVWLMQLTEQLAWRLRRQGLQGKTVQLKVRYHDFHTITRAKTLPQPTDVTDEIWQAAAELLSQRLPQRQLSVRLLGIGMSGLGQRGQTQPLLFDDAPRQAQARLDATADQIRSRYGAASLKRASGLTRRTSPE